MKIYFLLILAKAFHRIIPHKVLMFNLRHLYKITFLQKYVNLFDPNFIRKKHDFNLPERQIEISNKEWILILNCRDHIGFQSYISNQPFEMNVYFIAEKLKSLNKKLIVDIEQILELHQFQFALNTVMN